MGQEAWSPDSSTALQAAFGRERFATTKPRADEAMAATNRFPGGQRDAGACVRPPWPPPGLELHGPRVEMVTSTALIVGAHGHTQYLMGAEGYSEPEVPTAQGPDWVHHLLMHSCELEGKFYIFKSFFFIKRGIIICDM